MDHMDIRHKIDREVQISLELHKKYVISKV